MGAMGPQFQLGAQYAAELRIILVYLSESLGRLGQNGGWGYWGRQIFHWGRAAAPLASRRTTPAPNTIFVTDHITGYFVNVLPD